MSPFCLIDVAGMRDTTHVPHDDTRSTTSHARLSGWIARLLHIRRG